LPQRAFARVDIASLVFFRVTFGLLMAWQVWHYFYLGWIGLFWLEPSFLFKYYGFSWVRPWPGSGLYIHVAVLGVLALFIAAGFLYRLSATLFFIGWTYLFLLDEAQWRNHTYLISLFSFLLIFVPANGAFAVDSWLRPRVRAETTPAWTIWILRVQMGVVYFFAGVAKISPDWLHAEPMRVWLALSGLPTAIDHFLKQPPVYYAFAYAALGFDLFVVAFLLWRRTRVAAFCTAVVFHLINARLFPLEVFPWLSIAATTMFLSPDWPRRVWSALRNRKTALQPDRAQISPTAQRVTLTLLSLYVAVQMLVPLRHFLYHGGVEWWYSEHRFSWRMLIQRPWAQCYFYVTDPNTGATAQVRPIEHLSPWQAQELGFRPDMIVQFAKYLAESFPHFGPKPLRVEARVSVSIHGRKPQLLIDPNVDLASEKITIGRPRWLLEIHEPLPTRRPDPKENPFLPKLEGID
jgi:hypothetical protein